MWTITIRRVPDSAKLLAYRAVVAAALNMLLPAWLIGLNGGRDEFVMRLATTNIVAYTVEIIVLTVIMTLWVVAVLWAVFAKKLFDK